jgi:hypothetical protein
VVKSDTALMDLSKTYIANHPDVSNRIFLQVWAPNLPSEHLFSLLPLCTSCQARGADPRLWHRPSLTVLRRAFPRRRCHGCIDVLRDQLLHGVPRA